MAVMDGDDAPAGLTFTAYAARIGRSQPYVSKLVRDGVIHGEALTGAGRDRRILPELADAQRAAASVRPPADAPTAPNQAGTLNAERTRLITAQANRAELETQARRGELIPRTALAEALPPLARRYADRIRQLIRDTVLDDVERATLLDRLDTETDSFITKALTDGGEPPAD